MTTGVFETWNGGLEKSALYLASVDGADAVNAFIEGNKGSFATLHCFDSEEEAQVAYEAI